VNWWNRSKPDKSQENRIIKRPPLDTTGISKVPSAPLKELNARDIDAIKDIEASLIKAGVIGEKGEIIETPERIDDVLDEVARKGSENVRELLGDPNFNIDLLLQENSGENFLIEEVDDDEYIAYDGFNETEDTSDSFTIEPEGVDGDIALRLPDGTTIFGRIPGES